jgi:hypothetical protein
VGVPDALFGGRVSDISVAISAIVALRLGLHRRFGRP